jgi:PmbA protein
MRDGPDKKPEAGFYAGGHHLAALPDRAEVGRKALERAITRVGETKGPTTRTVMVVDPSVSASLVQRLLGAASGWSVHQGRSFFAGRLGQQVVSDKLTIVDDPLVPRGLGSRHYDGEGIAARKLPILTAGRLDGFYLDTTYARKLGMKPTTGSGSNRLVTPGRRDLAAILADVGSALYVTGWLGGNSDGTTGDFSLGCRGHVVSNGVIGPSVGEMNVTGNLLALFRGLVEVGSDPWPYGATRVPTLVFDGVQFSGA